MTTQRELHNNEHRYLEYLEIRNEMLTVLPYGLFEIKANGTHFTLFSTNYGKGIAGTLWEIGNSCSRRCFRLFMWICVCGLLKCREAQKSVQGTKHWVFCRAKHIARNSSIAKGMRELKDDIKRPYVIAFEVKWSEDVYCV